MSRKTLKSRKSRKSRKSSKSFAEKGTNIKCLLKTCRAKRYQSIYGVTRGGTIRSPKPLY
jgi:hypothetical protein